MAVFSRTGVLGVAVCALISVFAEKMPLAECREKASAGDAEAQWQMGQRYEEGRGVAKNAIRAVIQYKKAAEQKHPKACEKLAELYSRGELVKKDAVLAAKYRALAGGENAELAAARATDAKMKSEVDEIEVALDYLLGRNGKERDPKTGIRVLYSAAKDKPTAQRVFVDKWCTGELDCAFEALSDEEFWKIEPWFLDAYNDGMRKAAYILGLFAYEKSKNGDLTQKSQGYALAERYWGVAGKAGIAKAWYMLGRKIYLAEEKDEEVASVLRKMHFLSDSKAKDAFQKALRIDPKYDDARWWLGQVCLLSSDKRCTDSQKAFTIFEEFYKLDKSDKLNVYYYGLSGWSVAVDAINKDLELYKKAYSTSPSDLYYKVAMKRQKQYEQLVNQEKHYLKYIEQAAEMGCASAKKVLENYRKKSEPEQ